MSKMNSRISEREKKKAREKERFFFDPKIVCSVCQTSTNNQIPNLKLFVKIKQKNPCQTSNINNWFECFWFLIAFLLYPNIRRHQPKESNLLLQKRIKKKDDNDWNQLITNKTNSKQFALKYIPQKYICKKVYNSKI